MSVVKFSNQHANVTLMVGPTIQVTADRTPNNGSPNNGSPNNLSVSRNRDGE